MGRISHSSHCIGPSIQTALFNAPLAVIVSWGLGKNAGPQFRDLHGYYPRSFHFGCWQLLARRLLQLSGGSFTDSKWDAKLWRWVLTFGQIVYVIVALTTWFYPNAELTTSNGASGAGGGENAKRMVRAAAGFMN